MASSSRDRTGRVWSSMEDSAQHEACHRKTGGEGRMVGTAGSVLAGQGMGSSCPVAVVGSLFSISCTKDIVYTEGQDKTLMATSLSSSRLVFNLSCIAGFVYCFAINHIEPSTIAIGAGDGQIRVWRMGGRAMVSMTCIHAKMNQSKFMSLAWYHIGRG